MKKLTRLLSVGLLLAMGGTASAQEALKWKFVSFLAAHTSTGIASKWWMDEVEKRSNGRITFDAFYGATLIPPQEIFPALEDGRIQVGWGVHSYSAKPYPLTKISELPFQTRNPLATTHALNKMYELSGELRQEWESKGLRPLAFIGSSPNVTGSKIEIDSWKDYKGMRIRALDYIAVVLQEAGANVVSLPATELYESLQRGLVEAYSAFRLDLVGSLRLAEQAPFVVDDGTGVYGNQELVINLGTWNALPEDLRGVIEEVNSELPAKMAEIYAELDIKACETIREAKATVTILPAADTQEWRQAVEGKVMTQWKAAVGNDSLADAYQAQYRTLVSEGEARFTDYKPGTERCQERTN